MPGYFPLESLRGLYPEFTLGAVTPGYKRGGGPAVGPGAVGGAAGAGGLTPATPTEYSPEVGGKPVVPDPLAAARAAIAAAAANLPSAIEQAGTINAANQAAALKQITDLYPQFGANVGQMGANIGSWARGEIAPETVAMLAQRAAERGVSHGFGGNSPNANAAYLRALGLTSEDLQQRALTGQNTLLAGLPHTALTDPTRLNVSADTLANSLYNAQLLANVYQAAPNPSAAYNLAMRNAITGAQRGYGAGRTPAAGMPSGGIDPSTQALLNSLISRTQQNNMPQPIGPYNFTEPNATPSASTNPNAGTWNIPGYGFGTNENYDLDYLMYGLDPMGIYGGEEDVNYDPFNNEGG